MAKNNKKCENCTYMRRGDCGGLGRVCEDYTAAYNISLEEMRMWPGDHNQSSAAGVHYKSQASRMRGEYWYPTNRLHYDFDYIDN